ncbi:MAG: UDP-N-acetylmuramate dehydrogenase [Patescibacteria group bacterium]|jgi:UDP-N-acetylmuramate dehydrogenase
MRIQENIILSPYTTFHIGGAAKYFVTVTSEEELIEALKWAKDKRLNILPLGAGSNLLISDKGFDGLVVKIDIGGIEKDRDFISCGAGEKLDTLVAFCVENGLQGMECLSGIPGSVGGSVVQNAGAFGQEICETLKEVHIVDTKTIEHKTIKKSDCAFTYRSSVLIGNNSMVVTKACFELHPVERTKISFESLKKELGDAADIKTIRDTILKERKLRSSFYDEKDPNSISAGCFFSNPIVERSCFERISRDFPDIPHWDDKERVKLSAGWMVEKSGFKRGHSEGNVGLSEKHALMVINKGGADAEEIKAFTQKIRETVKSVFGVEMAYEVIFID